MSMVIRFLKNESGATMIEYGLLAALISVVAIAAITSAGQSVNNAFETVATALSPL